MAHEYPKQTLNEALGQASFFLQQAGHSADLARTYWQMLFDWDLTRTLKELHQVQPSKRLLRFQDALHRVVEDEPIQYIAGFAYFMEDRFRVSLACLIPREETQGLVERVLKVLRNQPDASVLDLGTGSGIIAIEVKKACPQAQVWASDISPSALALAKQNAADHHTLIHFCQSDVFDQLPTGVKFDVIVSNPPYIGRGEVDQMDASVKKYEPHEALFADQEGLAIYQRIFDQAGNFLHPGGQLLMEIGYRQGPAIERMADQQRVFKIQAIDQDHWGKDRYVHLSREKES